MRYCLLMSLGLSVVGCRASNHGAGGNAFLVSDSGKQAWIESSVCLFVRSQEQEKSIKEERRPTMIGPTEELYTDRRVQWQGRNASIVYRAGSPVGPPILVLTAGDNTLTVTDPKDFEYSIYDANFRVFCTNKSVARQTAEGAAFWCKGYAPSFTNKEPRSLMVYKRGSATKPEFKAEDNGPGNRNLFATYSPKGWVSSEDIPRLSLNASGGQAGVTYPGLSRLRLDVKHDLGLECGFN